MATRVPRGDITRIRDEYRVRYGVEDRERRYDNESNRWFISNENTNIDFGQRITIDTSNIIVIDHCVDICKLLQINKCTSECYKCKKKFEIDNFNFHTGTYSTNYIQKIPYDLCIDCFQKGRIDERKPVRNIIIR